MIELKPVRCGCGGEAGIVKHEFVGANPRFSVMCAVCGMETRQTYTTEGNAVRSWNKAMGERTVQAELNPLAEDIVIGNTTFKIGTRVIAECECGTWLRIGCKYCPNCGAKIDWGEE